MFSIPIIDMSPIREIVENVGENSNWISVAGEIREGLGNVGFIYLKNHGIDKSLVC